jgi:GTPase
VTGFKYWQYSNVTKTAHFSTSRPLLFSDPAAVMPAARTVAFVPSHALQARGNAQKSSTCKRCASRPVLAITRGAFVAESRVSGIAAAPQWSHGAAVASTMSVSADATGTAPAVQRPEQTDEGTGTGGNQLYGEQLRRAAGCNTDREVCVLVGVDVTSRKKMGKRIFGIKDSMNELGRLAETAGMQVAGIVTQQLSAPFSGTYIGTGKVGEVRSEMQAAGCKTCIFDDELSPAQQRTLENAFGGESKGIKVIDRTALILDIFAQHAATREGQLQVELALYQYRLPRLTRMWTHLERQSGSGGVGLRGPGETQLESDRRLINARIVKLRKEIDLVRNHRTRQRSARRANVGLPVVALIGYTNAGKSTVLNAFTGSNVLAADALFATLDPTTRRAKLVGLKLSPEILVTDTVGFVQNLPTQLVAAFRATLEEAAEADVLVHVVDASIPWKLMSQQITAVNNVLKQIGADGKPTIVALNKIDLLPDVNITGVFETSSSSVPHHLPADVPTVFGSEYKFLPTIFDEADEDDVQANIVVGEEDDLLEAFILGTKGEDGDIDSGVAVREEVTDSDDAVDAANKPHEVLALDIIDEEVENDYEGLIEDEPQVTVDSLLERVREFTGYEAVGISARTGAGVDEVGVLLEEVLQDVLMPIEAMVPYSRGDLVAAIHEQGSVEFEDFTVEGTRIVARAPHALASRLRAFAVATPENEFANNPKDAREEDDAEDWTALAKGRH